MYDEARFTLPPEAAGASTVSAIARLWLKLPDFPVMVTVDAPGAAEAETTSVKTQVVGVLPGPNDAPTPAGTPARVTVTGLENPFSGVSVSVVVPAAPPAILKAVGDADRLKLGGALMVSAIETLLVKLPDVPVIVTVTLAAAALAGTLIVTTLV